MPLDRHAKRLLDMVRVGGMPATSELSVANMRDAMRQLARVADASDIAIDRVDDVTIPGPGGTLAIRVYTPQQTRDATSAGVVYFHGGMGVFSDIDTHDGVCRLLANGSGCRIFSVQYRLAPEHPFPAGIEDAVAATSWVSQHAGDLRVDASRLGVAGDSAGGTLAIAVCLLAKESGGPPIALQALLCPVTDLSTEAPSRLEFAHGYFIERSVLEWAKTLYCPNQSDLADPRVSPLRAGNFSGLPPAIIHTAEFDPVRDEGAAYAQALDQAGVPVRYLCQSGMIHNFYCMSRVIPSARAIVTAIGAEIGAALSSPLAARE